MKKLLLAATISSLTLSQFATADAVQFDANNANTFTNVEHQIVINQGGTNYCMDVKSGDGGYQRIDLNVMDQGQNDCNTKWNFDPVANGEFKVRAQGTNNCMSIEWVWNGIPDEQMGAGIRAYDCDDASSWDISYLANNVYAFANPSHNSCLTFGSPETANKDLIATNCNLGGTQQFTLPRSEQVCDEPAFMVYNNPTHRFDGEAVYGHFDGINCKVRAKPQAARFYTGEFDVTNNEFHMTLDSSGECFVGKREGNLCYLGTPPAGSYIFEWAGYLYYTP